jgi:hypothetical protein
MDIATLTAFLSPFLPFLLKLGGKAINKSTESGEAAWGNLEPQVEVKESRSLSQISFLKLKSKFTILI